MKDRKAWYAFANTYRKKERRENDKEDRWRRDSGERL